MLAPQTLPLALTLPAEVTSSPLANPKAFDGLAAPSTVLVARTGSFNHNKSKQVLRYSGAPYSLGFGGNTGLGLEDFGLSNAASVKELQLR
jgi:hypothetical protein